MKYDITDQDTIIIKAMEFHIDNLYDMYSRLKEDYKTSDMIRYSFPMTFVFYDIVDIHKDYKIYMKGMTFEGGNRYQKIRGRWIKQ